MDEMLRFSALCVVACLLITLINQGSRTMSSIVIIAAGVVLLGVALERGAYMLERLQAIITAAGINTTILMPVFKVLGIALCAKVTSELCRDMGSRWAASNIEIFAVITSIICMLPLLEEVLRLVGSI